MFQRPVEVALPHHEASVRSFLASLMTHPSSSNILAKRDAGFFQIACQVFGEHRKILYGLQLANSLGS
jgi:hypothetical protein